jgi:hypothetical protein
LNQLRGEKWHVFILGHGVLVSTRAGRLYMSLRNSMTFLFMEVMKWP